MSENRIQNITVGERVAGKWQIPSFIAACACLAIVAFNIESPDRKIGAEAQLERITQLNDSGMHTAAADIISRLLEWKDLDTATRAELLKQDARALFGNAERLADYSRAKSKEIINRYEQAELLEAQLDATDHRRSAKVHERLDQFEQALKRYEKAAELAESPALDDRRRVIELSSYPLRLDPDMIDDLLQKYVADAQDVPQQLIWALSRRIELLSQKQAWSEAAALLEEYEDRFADTDLEREYTYLTSYALWGSGRYDDAEKLLRELLNRCTVSDPVFAKASWLLGKVVMNDGRAQRPEEAVATFREVIASRADREYVAASRLGLAEALAELERYESSLQSYENAVFDLRGIKGSSLINPDVIRSSLTVCSEKCRRAGLLGKSLSFMELAVQLVNSDDTETLSKYLVLQSDLQAAVARDLMEEAKAEAATGDESVARRIPARAQELFDKAGESYVRVSWMSTLSEDKASDAMWSAAGLFDEGGNHRRAIEVLKAFVRDRSDAEIIPRVLLRLGKSLQAIGEYEEAVEVYQRNTSSFPRSPFAHSSLIPLAECLMALGGDREAEAERALNHVTKGSQIFTPAAPEYRDAMFLLGELYSRQGKYEDAISVLDEVLKKYGDDPRYAKAAFLMANAYRNSAMAIKDEILKPEYVGESKRLQVEYEHRLAEAARRFGELSKLLEGKGESTLDSLDQMYLQDSRLYEGTCLFELGRYKESLALYEQAAWIYKDSSVALGAYVQVINCYIFLGREEEAESALRRAQYLVETIPEEKFAGEGQFETRDGWRRYFDWVAEILISDKPRELVSGGRP